ncbi:MAG: hypothetical protein ACOYM0_16135 [Bacteroidales bacterium]
MSIKQPVARFSAGIIIFAVLFISAAAGCKKKDSSYDLSPNLNIANDIVFAERGLFHTFDLLLKANLDSAILKYGVGSIDKAGVRYDSAARQFIFYYQSRICADSVDRNGNIIVNLSGNFFSPGTHAKVVFENYSEDSRQFIGSDSLFNEGNATGSGIIYASFIDSLIISKDASQSTKWHSLFVYHLPDAITILPDSLLQLTITGSAFGSSSAGYPFLFQISYPLLNDFNCPWIRQGVMSLSTPSVQVTSGYIEYANQAICDNRVTYIFDGNIFKGWINRNKLNF